MLNNLRITLNRTPTNVKGWRTNKRIVIIESDDWGGVRMPNRTIRDAFQEKGYNILSNPYCKFDTLADTEDLEKLFSVLLKHKDENGNHPAITANTVLANPNFEEIKNSGYSTYSFKPFTTTLKEYYPEENVFAMWKEGLDKRVFVPQFHGREHMNVLLWLDQLQKNNKVFIDAFEMGFWGLPRNLYSKNIFNIQAAFGSSKEEYIAFYKKSIEEGLRMFESIFNYQSKTFIANNYTWSPKLHETLKKNGVIGFQGMKYQKYLIKNSNKIKYDPVFTGKRNDLNQVYTVRNSVFEPSQRPHSFNNVKHCIKEIENSFFFRKPAIISSHRLNFIGAISSENRDRNLELLDELLSQILKKWPDVKFMTSDQLALNLYNNEK